MALIALGFFKQHKEPGSYQHVNQLYGHLAPQTLSFQSTNFRLPGSSSSCRRTGSRLQAMPNKPAASHAEQAKDWY
ncbi:hypothetical protein BABINDRAFT_161344 [Babjeviella inositovora NRRL Y-12698]|uniref:Uncharacterized protein n=1 Tax=Babjeviella inositovora NRRL Y-12698 TaxID=984486 RepID=A0A1E3QRY1_9ASCO|nr:uncharacterized protein BABINDRAFT_161344 [Babjeviella inositovora NRRL Y-12698]ODQ80398.1 hypothetical protein BABINDRAFT_161344 [Babjeviella inositovora NRRL Y-12698]